MSDDIVTMLRREYDYFNNDGVGDYELLMIAADEIERLRVELEETRKGREAYGQVIFSLQEQIREYEDD